MPLPLDKALAKNTIKQIISYRSSEEVTTVTNIRSTLSNDGHTDRVNCVRWVSENIFLSSSADKSIIVWKEAEDGSTSNRYDPIVKLKGHSSTVTVVDGVLLRDGNILVASASGDSTLKLWYCRIADQGETSVGECVQTIMFKGGSFAIDVKMSFMPSLDGAPVHSTIPNTIIIASMDNCNASLYGFRGDEFEPLEKFAFEHIHSLIGHDDWIQCIDVINFANSLWIATGAQDSLIRIWKISALSQQTVKEEQKRVKDLLPGEEIRLTETIFDIGGPYHDNLYIKYFSIRVETILSGHDDKIFGVQWGDIHKPRDGEKLSLLSCSMDKTMIIWKPTDELDGTWVDSVRVGEVGGNTLGFLGCQFGNGNNQILSYSFNGALHLWTCQAESNIWKPGVAASGHYSSVQDLDWERDGKYFVTVSLDQTTRVHAPWNNIPSDSGDKTEIDYVWHEIARPQVHGHDLFCVTMLSGHRLASGADEKIIRTFEGTKIFLKNLAKISGIEQKDLENSLHNNVFRQGDEQAQGASVPSLGLSNKPIMYNEDNDFVPRAPEEERHVKDQFPDFYFTPETHTVPPPEESLIQNTLWPELHKLYGHGNEMFAVSSNPAGNIIASACKASKADQADVILWDAKTWKLLQRLPGHSLTVTQIEFSPCGEYLLSSSRDRSWHLFQRETDESSNNQFRLCANTDKKTSVHQRLIWTCSWSHDSQYFATGSRDKKIAVWSKNEDSGTNNETSCLGAYGLACSEPIVLESAVTAIAFSKLPHENTEDKQYVIAAGLETGKIVLILWNPNVNTTQWKILKILSPSEAHHKAVKRLKFRPVDSLTKNVHYLASCGEDHIVKLFTLRFK